MWKPDAPLGVEVSFCVVNTDQRELLVHCLDALAAERERLPFETEVLVLDNASTDGSAGAARRHPTVTEVVALDQRRGKGENDSHLLQRSRGRFCLLLNEDSELRAGATAALHAALEADPGAAAAGAKLLRPDGRVQPSAWKFPTAGTALIGAFFLHKRLTVESRGRRTRRVDWAQSAALLVRRDAARDIGWFDPQFFVYSDEVDFCRRLADAGWHTLWVPAAEAIHHEQLSTGAVPERRIVELLPQPRPLHAQAPLGGLRVRRAPPDGLGLRGPGGHRHHRARPRPEALLAPRDRHTPPVARRGPARGGARVQPRRADALRRRAAAIRVV